MKFLLLGPGYVTLDAVEALCIHEAVEMLNQFII